MKTLALSPDISLPLSAVTQKLAFLGISGSGKTYAAGKLVEELIDAGAQVVVLDTVGNWYGLRLLVSGKPGIPIPIWGGAKGDAPLDPAAGRQVAETVAESRASMVVDVSDMTKGELGRFARDFAIELYRLKKRAPSPVMIVWEECQDIVPQRVFGEQAQTVGAVERLIKKGRNYGVGTVLISQRPAAVNKDVLSQVETVFAFRMNGKHDRKAMSEWIVEKDLDIGALIDELPAMKTGTCYLWSPQWLEVFQKIKIGKKRTFDASATPEMGDEVKAGKLAPVDLEKFKGTMAAAIEKARANDPEALKARIRQLEKEMRPTVPVPRLVVAKPVLNEKDFKRLERAVEAQASLVDQLSQRLQVVVAELHSARTLLKGLSAAPPNGHGQTRQIPRTNEIKHPVLRERVAAENDLKRLPSDRDALTGPELRILDALAWLETIGVTEPENAAVAFVAKYSPTSGGYFNPRGALRQAGRIEYLGDDRISLTDAGRRLAAPPERALDHATLHQMVLSRLGGPEQRILRPLLEAYPKVVSNDDLAAAAGYSPTSGGYFNPRGKLRTLGLVEYVQGGVRARSILFP